MVLNTTHAVSPPPVLNNKENLVFKTSSSILRNTYERRPRSRTHNAPSRVVIAREAARDPRRLRAQSPSAVAQTHTRPFSVEDSDVEMADVGTPSGSSCPQRSIHLPRHLRRPSFKDISVVALEAIDADLKDVATEYIREKLQYIGQQLFAVSATTTANPPRDRLPRELQVVVNDIAADAPTHLFAVYARPATRISIHPAHALVFAIHCANLPSLPYSKPATPTEVGTSLTLPVVPLCLPNPETFPILMHYLYTQRGDQLLASLLPVPPGGVAQSLDQLSQTLAATFTVQALLSRAAKVHGLWSNVTALGVFDEKLWRGIEMVWEVLLGALAVSTGSSWRAVEHTSSRH